MVMWKMAIYIKPACSLSCPYILFCSFWTISHVFTSLCKTAAGLCNQSGLKRRVYAWQARLRPCQLHTGLQYSRVLGRGVPGTWSLITMNSPSVAFRLRKVKQTQQFLLNPDCLVCRFLCADLSDCFSSTSVPFAQHLLLNPELPFRS